MNIRLTFGRWRNKVPHARAIQEGYVGVGDYHRYREATDLAAGVMRKGYIAVELGNVPDLVAALDSRRIPYDIEPALSAALQRHVRKVRADRAQADDRMDRVDEVLAGRGLRLFPFQRDGVAWMAGRQRCALFDEPGLGKTVQTLVALPDGAPAIVIPPAAVKGVWRQECRKWRPEYDVEVLAGRKSMRAPRAGELLIANYEILHDDPPELASGTVVVCDEAHAAKNPKAKRTKRVRALVDAALKVGGRVIFLTGTPLLGKPEELWQVLASGRMHAEAFGSWQAFYELFGGREARYGTEWAKTPAPEVGDRLRRVSLRRTRVEVLPDLPTKIYRHLDVGQLDNEASREADEVLDILREEGIEIDSSESLQSALKFDQMSRARASLAAAKVPAMLERVEQLEEEGQPLVVFSAHRAPVDELEGREGWAVIHGDVPPERRTEIVDEFQAGELRGVALTIAAGGTGLTLTRAHHVLFVDLAFTPALNAQAEDRVCRIGQDRGVIVIRLVADHPLDQHVTELLARKQALIDGSVERSTRTEIDDDTAALARVASTAGPSPSLHSPGGIPPESARPVQASPESSSPDDGRRLGASSTN